MTSQLRIKKIAFVLFASLLALDASRSGVLARITTPCDSDETHGRWTDVLCVNDHLVQNSYIKSANDLYVLHLGDNSVANVFDVSNYENWELLYEFQAAVPGHAASNLAYGNNSSGGTYPFNWALWCIHDQVVGGEGFGYSPVGAHWMKIDNDGCVRIYDEAGYFTTPRYGAATTYSAACASSM